MSDRIASRLLPWYHKHGRTLPWREHPDPYSVWVSEIMLQQTRVTTVIPYFEKWMQVFPTIESLAAATEREVLNAWEGLGYYSRARNLHKAAKMVVERHNGELPRDLKSLRDLPGIGRYTVGAIASIAFGMDEPILDGNLRRVFSRLIDLSEPVDSGEGENLLWELAAEHLPAGRAGAFNQALMDLGATLCIPKNPRCMLCPLRDICKARVNGTQAQRPVYGPRQKIPHQVYASAIVLRGGRTLLGKRPTQGLLGGMWAFPNARVEGDPQVKLYSALETEYNLKVRWDAALGVIEHAYTHFRVSVHVFRCTLLSEPKHEDFYWIRLSELEEYPMGKVDRQIAGMLYDDV